jgi:hypothetical protein
VATNKKFNPADSIKIRTKTLSFAPECDPLRAGGPMFIFICATPRKMFKIPEFNRRVAPGSGTKGQNVSIPVCSFFFSLIPAISGNDGNFVCERY